MSAQATNPEAAEAIKPSVIFSGFLKSSEKIDFTAPFTAMKYSESPEFNAVYAHLHEIFTKYEVPLTFAATEVGRFKEYSQLWNRVSLEDKSKLPSPQMYSETKKTMEIIQERLTKLETLSKHVREEFETGLKYFETKIETTAKFQKDKEESKALKIANQQLNELGKEYAWIKNIHSQLVERFDHNALRYFNIFKDHVAKQNAPQESNSWFNFLRKSSTVKTGENTGKTNIEERSKSESDQEIKEKEAEKKEQTSNEAQPSESAQETTETPKEEKKE
ncbi:MAG: hypothetical protein Tsb0015_11400 [Simkaniaceae bacterium]